MNELGSRRVIVTTGRHRHLWWLIALLVMLAIFLIGVGVTQGVL